MEISLGQFSSRSPMSLWVISPLFKGTYVRTHARTHRNVHINARTHTEGGGKKVGKKEVEIWIER